MTLAVVTLYFALLVVLAGSAVLWSNWPERRGGWLLATKHKLPPLMQSWHSRNVIPVYILAGVLFLLFTYLEYNAVKDLAR
jgi:hypothetical protein